MKTSISLWPWLFVLASIRFGQRLLAHPTIEEFAEAAFAEGNL